MNIKKHTVGALVSAGTTLTMVIGLSVGVAHADPVASAGTSRTIAISGSDTTDEVMQALAEDAAALAIGGTRQVENWSALGGGTVTPHPGAANTCTVTRPNGSGNGRAALLASIGAGATTPNCFQGSRSSSLSLGATGAGKELVYVPFAKEAVSFAITNTSNVLRNQTFARIKQFYECKNSSGTVLANPATKAMLPQLGSGTRKFWLLTLFNNETADSTNTTLGATITSNTTTGLISAGCVENGRDEFTPTANPENIQEHTGGQVNDNEITPYSVGQWTSQASGVTTEARGKTTLGQVSGTNPFTAGAFIQRSLYNVFPAAYIPTTNTSAEATAARTLFLGSGSQICGATSAAIVQRFGLFAAPDCGDTSQQTV